MALPSFTVTGNLFEITGAISASELAEFPPTTLRFTFTTNLTNVHDMVTYNGNLYKIGQVYAGIEDDGTILQASMVNGQVVNSSDNVKLLAQDPSLNVTNLYWRVQLESPIGTRWRELTSWWIIAASDGATVNLEDTVTDTELISAPWLTGGTISDGAVTFTDSAGGTLTPIDIPAGVSVWVDNGDSTWSVG